MAFPSSPTNGQVAVINGIYYTYSSTKNAWTRQGNNTSSVQISNANASTSTATGALVVTGGVGIGGNAFVGANLNVTGNTNISGNLVVTRNGAAALDVIGEIAEFAHNVNSYAQIHVRNTSSGTSASTDLVATADNGTDSTNFIDLGINSSGYNDAAFTIVTANDGYLYTSNGNLGIGTASARAIEFFTGGTLSANERMRIESSGNVGIGNTAPVHTLSVNGNISVQTGAFIGVGSGFLMLTYKLQVVVQHGRYQLDVNDLKLR